MAEIEQNLSSDKIPSPPRWIIPAVLVAVFLFSGIFLILHFQAKSHWATVFSPEALRQMSFMVMTDTDDATSMDDETLVIEMALLEDQLTLLSQKGAYVKDALHSEIEQMHALYLADNIHYGALEAVLQAYGQVKACRPLTENLLTASDAMEEYRNLYREAEKQLATGDSLAAMVLLDGFPQDDPSYSPKALALYDQATEQANKEITNKVGLWLSRYQPEQARAYLTTLDDRLFSQTITEQEKRIKAYVDFQATTETYTGPVEHLFTHCLIAFPEICYAGNSMTKSLDTDCVTPREWSLILNNLYEKDYILIDINRLLAEGEDQTVGIAEIKVPKGKIPLVLSVDDVVYDSRKMSMGMVDKLMVDGEGMIYTYTKHVDGSETVSYSNEVFPLVDQFCMEHPDFSFQGARGTLALTGFQGILGYRTQADAPAEINREWEKEQAQTVARGLKENGWTFGSHSYGHGHMREKMTLESVQQDTRQWLEEVAPLVGSSQIFFYPYGESVKQDDPKFNVLYDSGFRLFCGVGNKNPYLVPYKDKRGIFQDRRSIDGYSLRNFTEYLDHLFNTEEILDPVRWSTGE